MVNIKEKDPVHGLESLTTSPLLFILSPSGKRLINAHKFWEPGGFCVSVSKAFGHSVHVPPSIQLTLRHTSRPCWWSSSKSAELSMPQRQRLFLHVCLVTYYIQSHFPHKFLPSCLQSAFRSTVFTSIILCLGSHLRYNVPFGWRSVVKVSTSVWLNSINAVKAIQWTALLGCMLQPASNTTNHLH
jgi:hypothetical protein